MTNAQAQIEIKKEWNRRQDLVECPKFRKLSAEMAKKLGITAKDWNENRAYFLIVFCK